MVGLAIALALQSAATPVPVLTPGETLLEVSAEGVAKGVPDVASFTSGVTADGATAQAALAANSAIAQRLIAAARRAGVAETAIRSESLSVRPRYAQDKDGDDTDRIVGYRASNQLNFRLTEIARAPAVIDALFQAGATDLSGPTFDFADDAPLISKARAQAVAAAQVEANDYARALGRSVGRVLRVSERSAGVPYSANDVVVTGSRASAPPVQPGEREVKVTVWIDYALTK